MANSRMLDPDQHAELKELSLVFAVNDIRDGSEFVAEGSTGTIVFVHGGGAAYQVEFTSPRHSIVFARREDIGMQ